MRTKSGGGGAWGSGGKPVSSSPSLPLAPSATKGRHSRGGALLAVLWLSAALAAIALSVATTVRGETERAATASEGVRAHFLAAGAIERALLWMQWGQGARTPDGRPRYWDPANPYLRLSFPGGETVVEVIPESSKLSVNAAPPADIVRLLIALGVDFPRAQEIAAAIVDWRTGQPLGAMTPFDQFYSSLGPTFRAPHASFEEVEEVLLVKGMTPDIFYGGYGRDAQGHLVPRPGLRDCISVYGWTSGFDVNTAEPALLVSLGIPPELVARLVDIRRVAPFRSMEQLAGFGLGGFPRLAVGSGNGSSMVTLRATARPRLPDGRLSDLRRTSSGLVKFFTEAGATQPYQIVRWYENTTPGSIVP